MSDLQRDREERQHVIEVLKSWDGYFIGYTSDEVQEALRYAIASIETDLKYDLLYEETSGQADKQADKPTTKKDCNTCTHGNETDGSNCYECVKDMCNNYEPTTKNDVPDINVGKIDYVSRKEVIEQCQEWRNHEFVTMTNPYYYLEKRLNNLISVTPLSSGLEKNSKKLEKNFGESDCISREQALRELKESAEHHANDSREEVLLRRDRDIIRALPAVTPQESRIDFEELKRKILMEVDGGTDDAWLAYGEVCDRISNSIDKFVADMRGDEE